MVYKLHLDATHPAFSSCLCSSSKPRCWGLGWFSGDTGNNGLQYSTNQTAEKVAS
uniref:Uncharacterized protein n=1 Tax=Arundo donax TaxID=35708 RepID=A0A0A9CT00_ARUDO